MCEYLYRSEVSVSLVSVLFQYQLIIYSNAIKVIFSRYGNDHKMHTIQFDKYINMPIIINYLEFKESDVKLAKLAVSLNATLRSIQAANA